MITGILIGFILGVVLLALVGSVATNYAIKRRWYASAIWNESEQIWKVQGHYLSIATKIHDGIRQEQAGGEKSVMYTK